MIDRGNNVVDIAPIKHNFPAELVWAKLNEGRLYRRDPETFTLVPVEVAASKMTLASPGCDEQVAQAVERLNLEGVAVRRTGRAGLYEIRAPDLAGLSRGTIAASVTRLIQAGRIIDTGQGLKVSIPPEDAALVAKS